jgi:beta-1,4-N-acetylglucosaminyltransferase
MISGNILCILGNDRHKFDRIVILAENIAMSTNKHLILQAGQNQYNLKTGEQFDFLEKTPFSELISKADIVISHCGSGSLRRIIMSQKKSIILPRLKFFGEHIDDHQIQIAKVCADNKNCYLPKDFSEEMINAEKCIHALESYPYFFGTDSEVDLSDEIAYFVSDWVKNAN